MTIRTITTKSSIWQFDLDAKMYVRLPRDEENANHPSVPYTGEWEPFDELVESEENESDNRLLVIRPVEWGTGRLRMTGEILSDVTTTDTDAQGHAA